ncbi:hypothetical protein ZIOFF_026047 [Zingiber officinale]|uniref:Uncharacterized protein n=1 Tax=Zingiber officinale TaxID=94328 RepID=A0A8J5GVV3_ZINOF|nr:hypothetical protein ZIOFF_026047 [Zingiber officinale]
MDAGADNAPLVATSDEGGLDDIDVALHRLEGFLCLLGFPDSTSSQAHIAASWAAFLLLGVAVPCAAIFLSQCSPSVCEEYKVEQFELCVLLSEVSLAAVSLVCISHNLLKYGIRRFLFVDQHHGHVQRFQKEYVRKIQVGFLRFFFCFSDRSYSGKINFTNAGSLAVSSVVQVVVIVLCLNAASKISHRAQRIGSLASRWHAYATCCPTKSQVQDTSVSGNMEDVSVCSSSRDYSENDLESLENSTTFNNAHLASFMPSYHKRQALGM